MDGTSLCPGQGKEERQEAASRAGSLLFRQGLPRGTNMARSPGDGKKNISGMRGVWVEFMATPSANGLTKAQTERKDPPTTTA